VPGAMVPGGMVPGGMMAGGALGMPGWGTGPGLEPPGLAAPANVVTINPGMTMAEVEKAVILAALRETRGNRRKAAEILDIGERTLYRKLKEYQVPDRFGE